MKFIDFKVIWLFSMGFVIWLFFFSKVGVIKLNFRNNSWVVVFGGISGEFV